jgi:predicted O-methyltransferase YrrM
MSKGKYTFTSDWFSNNIPLWEKELAKYRGKPIKFLEIGTYEGRSAIWALENILTHPKSKIYCVDTFQEGTYDTYKKNISRFGDKVVTLKGKSVDMLKLPSVIRQQFDIVYIDSDSHSSQVLEDAVLVFPLIKDGGLLIFDDYTYSKHHDNRCPKQGIDAFLNAYAEYVHVVYTKWQVIVQKRKVPRPKQPCRSEFYDF